MRSGSAMSLALLLIALALASAACGDEASGGDAPDLKVSAAASLKTALADAAPDFGDATVRLAFGGSDQLAAQIRSGARPDVFAAANAKLPQALFDEGLVEQPVAFAGNELVLAVPAGHDGVADLGDLKGDAVTIATGAPSVPVGSYTRQVLGRLPAGEREAIVANIASEEPDVAGVLAKLRASAVDAGFVYRTDVEAAGGELRAIALPKELKPEVVYEAAVVRGAAEPALARAYVEGLVDGPAATALRRAGFLPAP